MKIQIILMIIGDLSCLVIHQKNMCFEIDLEKKEELSFKNESLLHQSAETLLMIPAERTFQLVRLFWRWEPCTSILRSTFF